MSAHEPFLPLYAPPSADLTPDAQALVDYLATLPKHQTATAAELCCVLGWEPNETKKRRVRALCKTTAGLIASGPGIPFKLDANLTLSEQDHILNAIQAQIDDMQGLKQTYLDRWHRH